MKRCVRCGSEHDRDDDFCSETCRVGAEMDDDDEAADLQDAADTEAQQETV